MAEPQEPADERRRVPATVVNGTRVTVAFPFSQIRLQESSAELRLLALLVADLAAAPAGLAASDETAALRRRAADLTAALDGVRSAGRRGTGRGRG
jgi:hypothetical protein